MGFVRSSHHPRLFSSYPWKYDYRTNLLLLLLKKSLSSTDESSFCTNMTELKRGSGGRLEDAFLAAKARNEAAFVAFVTAGFPTAEGEWVTLSWLFLVPKFYH